MIPPVEEIDFGFFFCRVMAFYHLPPTQVLGLLTKTFWAMNGNIDRIQAQQDLRHLSVAIAATSGEAATERQKRLEVELGEIVKAPPVFLRDTTRDQAGFEELRAMAEEQ